MDALKDTATPVLTGHLKITDKDSGETIINIRDHNQPPININNVKYGQPNDERSH